MNTDSQNELLSAYLDGELTADERAQVEQMLAANPGARQLLDELRALSATLKSLPRQKLGVDLSESVLRIAERRMLTEPADTEQLGTGTSLESDLRGKVSDGSAPVPAFSEPLGKTILRRLKNPRIWVWQAVIVTTIILLLVYNPNRNLNQNAALPGNAERSIAMASKSGEKEPSSEPTSMRAAPSPATVKLEESLDVKIVQGKPSDTSGRLEGLEEVAKDEDAIASKRPARDSFDLAKKSNESVTLGDKSTAEDMPKTALKSAGRGYIAGAASATTPATPAADITPQGQAQSLPGGTQMAKTMNANKSLSETKPAEPPAEKQSADQFKAKAQATEELIVVRCEITPEALKNHAFDKLLADNSIVWSDTPKEIPYGDNLPKLETLRHLSDTNTDQTAVDAEGLDRGKGVRRNTGPSKAGPLDIVYVEASPAQIEATLNGLSAQNNMFLNVSITPEKEKPQVQQFVASDKSSGEYSRVTRGMQGNAIQPAVTAQNRFQFEAKIPQSSATYAVLGRAQRIPLSFGNAAKGVVEMEGQKHEFNLFAQKAAPKATAYGGISAGQSDKPISEGQLTLDGTAGVSTGIAATEQLRLSGGALNQPAIAKSDLAPASTAAMPPATRAPAQTAKQGESGQTAQNPQGADSQFGGFGGAQSGSASSPRMQRVLFVLQVVEQGNISGSAKESAPADATDVNAAPVDATSPAAIPGKK